MKITLFPDLFATTKQEHDLPWPAIVAKLTDPKQFAKKSESPLLKLGTFGDRRSERASLRSDDNMLVVTGLEGDYDGEVVTPMEAVDMLEKHGVRGCVYTSPSHTDEKPRWRVLAPFSVDLPTGHRAMLMRRLNGALGAILTGESFTTSQTYYYGRVNGHPYQCLSTFGDPEDGTCINELDALDDIAVGPPKASSTQTGDAATDDDLRAGILRGENYHDALRSLAARFAGRGMDQGDIEAALTGLMDATTAPHDERWKARRTEIKRLSADAVRKFQKAKPGASSQHCDKAAQDKPEWKPKPLSAAELLRTEYPPIRWTVEDILPEGLLLLAARPKIGKSWLALQIALGVANGADVLNRKTSKGSALYLALEDNPRRLQQRLFKCRAGHWADQAALTRVEFATEWKRADEGGIEDLYEWVDAHQDCRLVVIDTLEKFRARRSERANAYGEDYQALQGIKSICDTRRISIVVVHHTRKAAAEDPIDSISGTLGLGGAADGALVLTRQRGSEQAELHLIGRDIPGEGAYAVRFDRSSCMWTMEGRASEVAKTKERQDILDLLKRENKPMQPNEIADELGRKRVTVRRLLQGLITEGKLTRDPKGGYSLFHK